MPWLPEKLISETNNKTYLRTKKNVLIYLSLCTADVNTNYPTRQESNLVHDVNRWGTVRTVDILPLSHGDVYVFDINFLAFVSAKPQLNKSGKLLALVRLTYLLRRCLQEVYARENFLKID